MKLVQVIMCNELCLNIYFHGSLMMTCFSERVYAMRNGPGCDSWNPYCLSMVGKVGLSSVQFGQERCHLKELNPGRPAENDVPRVHSLGKTSDRIVRLCSICPVTTVSAAQSLPCTELAQVRVSTPVFVMPRESRPILFDVHLPPAIDHINRQHRVHRSDMWLSFLES